jgi:hemerythrin superfamily protein
MSKGQTPVRMKEAIATSEKLKTELPQMLKEHKQIVATLETLNKAAKEEKHPEVVRFTEALKVHAQTEEEVLYPTAILIGEYLKLKQ